MMKELSYIEETYDVNGVWYQEIARWTLAEVKKIMEGSSDRW